MNSFNHYAYGAIGEWLYKYVDGIDIDPLNPGYKHILFAPHPGGALSNASAELKSIYGPVKSSWSIDKSQFTYDLVIPANATATVTLPNADLTKVMLNQLPLSGCKECKATQNGDNTIVQLGSGSYRFSYSTGSFGK